MALYSRGVLDSSVAEVLTEGGVAVIPTDTVYGLVCRAADEQAVKRLYSLKQRANKPGTLIAASADQLVEIGINREQLKRAEKFWPGAISIVLSAAPNLKYLHQNQGSIAIRIPDENKLQQLLRKTGPLLTSSANTPGKPPATTVAEAKGYFSNKVDLYVEGGDLSNREPSTIIRLDEAKVKVLRQGTVKINESGKLTNEV